MSDNCDSNCSSCDIECSSRTAEKIDFSVGLNEYSDVKKVIGIVSGKGGVGKSLVTSLLAVSMNRLGYNTAILDADITGPSIPRAFGLTDKAKGSSMGIMPVKSREGIDIMSLNLLLENETDPVVWKGSLIGSTVKQFWTDVVWAGIDYMFIDMPPGTGDVPLTVFQSLPVDGIIIVTSPQELVSMIVEKAINMAALMKIPVIGLIENMSYFTCPDNGKRYNIFGDSHIDEIGEKYGLKVLAKLPINPTVSSAIDRGRVESLDTSSLEETMKILERI